MRITFSLKKSTLLGIILNFVSVVGAYAIENGITLENTRARSAPTIVGTQTLYIFPKGTSLSLQQAKNGWYEVVTPNGQTGWVAGWLIQKKISTQPIFGELLFGVRLRGDSSIQQNNIMAVFPSRTKVEIIGEKGEWYQVKVGSKEGFMMKEFIKKIDNTQPTILLSEITPSSTLKDISQMSSQVRDIPSGIYIQELQTYWLEKINSLRSEKKLRQLVLDTRWIDTATEWAGYMGKLGYTTHKRPDGKSMHQWVDTKGLDFTKRYSQNGWTTNYFTENIAWGISDGTTLGVKKILDNTLQFFLAEASYNGDHYRTIYHKDWNSLGLGFYFAPFERGKYKVYVAMHYGSLEQK